MRAPAINRSQLLTLLCVIAVSIPLFAASSANAGSYTFKACDKWMGSPNSDRGFWESNGGFISVNRCPDELLISNQFPEGSEPMTFGAVGGFTVPDGPIPYSEVRFDVSGGDLSGNIQYMFLTCPDTPGVVCEPIATIEPTSELEWVERTIQLGGVDSLRIEARCMAFVCPRAPDLRIKNFEFPIIDEVPPYIGLVYATTVNNPGFSIKQRRWIGGDEAVLFGGATDRETGIGKIEATIDGATVATYGCPYFMEIEIPVTFPCASSKNWSYKFDVTTLSNGFHSLQVDAFDVVGNAAESISDYFYVDSTPPRQPENPRIVNPKGFNGWSHDEEFEIAFDNPTLDPVNNDGAPLQYLRVDLEPKSGQVIDPSPFRISTGLWGPQKIRLPAEGRWRLWLWIEDHAGNLSNRAHIDLGLDRDQPVAPTLEKNDWISADRLTAGYNQKWVTNAQPSYLESGVCGFAFDVDDVLGAVPDIEIDAPAGATAAEVSSRIGNGRHYSHLRAVGCNGLASDADTVQLNVDGEAPEVAVFPPETDEWRDAPIDLTISGADDLSGVARILCRFPGKLAEVVEATRAEVPMPEGEQTIEFWAVDRAGNESERRTTTVRTDMTPPSVAFAPRSSQKPATLTAEVQDGGSGVATAWLEMSEAGSGAWRQFGAPVSPNAKSHSFSRDIPEHLGLLGTYEFRVVAVDRAGNRGVGTAGAGAQTLNLPVKSATALAFGLAEFVVRCRTEAGESCRSTRQCPRGSSCRRVRVLDRRSATAFKRTRFGEPLALVGTLSASDGTPLAGRSVEIVALPRFGVEQVIETVLTDDAGAFEHRLPDAPSTLYTARFAGDDTHAPQQQTVESSVRAKVSFRVSRKRIRANQIVRFSGRVYGAPEYAANGGKIVTIQFLRGRRWINTASSAQTGSAGRFSTTFSLPVVAKPTRVYFHAKVIPDGTWPFEVGSSEPRSVVFIP